MEDKEDKLLGFLLKQIETNPDLAEAKTKDLKGNFYSNRSSFIRLQRYAKDFLENKTDQRIVILPGLRGVGKTTLLFQIFKWLLNTEKYSKERVLYLSLDYLNETMGSNIGEIIEIYEKNILKEPIEKLKEPLIILIDEAHYDSGWQSVVKNLYDRSPNIFIFVSGSSALALNASADLARRSIIDHILPLTFQEYLKLKYDFYPPTGTAKIIREALNSKKIKDAEYILSSIYTKLRKKLTDSSINIEKELEQFLFTGGLPSSLKYERDVDTFRWIESVLDKIVTKDIPTYSNISSREAHNLFFILHFFAESSPPGPQSAAKIAKRIDKISETTVFNMLKALKNACIITPVKPKSSSLKMTKKSSINYLATPTLRCALLWALGKFDPYSSELKGVLMEEAILGILTKNIEKQNLVKNVYYDYNKNSADFVVSMPSGNIIIEIGWGNKSSEQVKNTMGRIKSNFGILIHNTNTVKIIENTIISIPKILLLFS